MSCVFFDNQSPKSFEEKLTFGLQRPYILQVKQFPGEDIVPLHYAATMELLLCDGLQGHITIDNRQYPLHGQQLFVIPPYTVHSSTVFPCPGKQYVLKVSFPDMEHYMNLSTLLQARNCRLHQLAYCCPEYVRADALIHSLIRSDGDLPQCLLLILELFLLLSVHTDPSRENASGSTRFKAADLQQLILWTQENYMRKITVEEAAKITGYSKYHFCNRFKSMTGMTYLSYLSSVRITHACLLLRSGASVQAACQSTGFESVSHFIQVFKRLQGVTPYQYAIQQNSGKA